MHVIHVYVGIKIMQVIFRSIGPNPFFNVTILLLVFFLLVIVTISKESDIGIGFETNYMYICNIE